MEQSDFWLEEPPANHSASQDSEKDWTTTVATWRSNSLGLLNESGHSGWSGKTCPVSCHRTEDGILAPSSGRWQKSGMGSHTEFLTLNSGEWPSDAAVCSLSDTLEAGAVPQRFFLSARACEGILRRAEKRGKTLPPILLEALKYTSVMGKTAE